MKDLSEYIIWANEDPNRVLVVPGTHMARRLVKDGVIDNDQVLDMYSLKVYNYPDLVTKEVAFYDYNSCLRDAIKSTLGEIVDLEHGTID